MPVDWGAARSEELKIGPRFYWRINSIQMRCLAGLVTTTLLLLGLSIGAQAQVEVIELTEEEAEAMIGNGVSKDQTSP